MNNNAWFKKENPFQTVIGFGGGATGFGAYSSSATKTYVDDVFSSYAYIGDGTNSHQIVNGIDLSGKGGFIWGKERGNSGSHYQFDTVRGLDKRLKSNSQSAEETDTFYSSVNEDGYTIEKTTSVNVSGNDYVSWSFAKQTGFFDIVSYTGNGSNRSISHSLGSVPGVVLIKNLDQSQNWVMYHKSVPNTGALLLDDTGSITTASSYWNDTSPTDSNFTVGTDNMMNGNGNNYIAYLFADGASNEATSRSVDFDGSSDYLLSTSSDYSPGTGDFTMEAWVNIDAMSGGNATNGIYQLSSTNGAFTYGGIALLYKNAGTAAGENRWELYGGNSTNQSESTTNTGYAFGQWVHTAIVKTSSTIKLYINGEERISAADTQDYSSYQYLGIGAAFASSYNIDGKVSNFKLTIGEALYTSAFTPTNVPLTTTSQSSTASNVKILCCNNSSVTGSTVAAGTITSNGTVTASTDNPNFVEPAATIFGENGDKNIIKCGSFIGNATSGLEIDLGWEPQWLLVKNASATSYWILSDSMRGISTGADDALLYPNASDSEDTSDRFTLTSTGFKVTGDTDVNGNGNTMVYMAIRRPDGYVGKLPSAGTGAFTMDTGNASTTIPVWDSGFPVDFAINRKPTSATSWYTSARLIQDYYLLTNSTAARNQDDGAFFDSNVGWAKDGYGTWDSTYQSWMWKRGQGMDVVTYTGNGSDAQGSNAHAHNLGQTPEMIWIHPLYGGTYSGVTHWTCSHKGLNGGTNPWQYTISLNNSWAEAATSNFGNTAPTSTKFYVGDPGNGRSNDNGTVYMAMLFASANNADGDPISKVGTYSGSGSQQTITTGFKPRFLILKNITNTAQWYVLDTTRGWTSSPTDEYFLELNTSDAQAQANFGYPTSTGFVLEGGNAVFSDSGNDYIYYAHA